jgi:4'-phosphopantetheinyl transferase
MPATIYWTLVDSQLVTLETEGILSPSEFQKFSSFRFPKRRNDWLLGRWTAKSLVHSVPAFQPYRLDQFEVRTTPQGAPYIELPGGTTPEHSLSISHSEHSSLCAFTTAPDLRVGADLEKIDARTATFILDYFTPAEQESVAACPAGTRAVAVTLIWSAKESMLKALGVGLHWDTRRVEVRRAEKILSEGGADGKWQEIGIAETRPDGRSWLGWWQRRGPFILTLAGYSTTQAGIQSVHLVEKKLQ